MAGELKYASRSVFELVEVTLAARGDALAAAADRIVLIPSGGAGSIGVVTMHVDYSKNLSEAGIKVTYIHGGAHKVDGNPYQPLPDDVRQLLVTIQHELFNLGGELSIPGYELVKPEAVLSTVSV